MLLPSVQAVNDRRIARFQKRISEGLELGDLDLFRQLIADFAHQNEVSELDIAAALARLLQGKTPLLLPASGDTAPVGGEFANDPRCQAAIFELRGGLHVLGKLLHAGGNFIGNV